MTAEARRVPADGVLTVYCQAEMLRLAAAGVPLGQASDAAFALFRRVAMTAAGMTVTVPARRVGTPTTCLTDSAAGVRDALALPWEVFIERHTPFCPSVLLPGDTIAALTWLADAVARVARGVPPLDAARQAHDHAEGRPRRKRKPADPDWLAAQITAAQATAWAAMRDQESWPRPLPAGPPAAVTPDERR